MKNKLKVIFLASEAVPFLKVGGLGDVAGSLPLALKRVSASVDLNLDIRLVLPFHGGVQHQGLNLRSLLRFPIPVDESPVPVEVLALQQEGLPVFFISSPWIDPHAAIYSSDPWEDAKKYTFFSLAALAFCQQSNWIPDVIHTNDWHTAIAAYAARKSPRLAGYFASSMVVHNLHNLPYLGPHLNGLITSFGLPDLHHPELPDWAQQLPLPLGLSVADLIVAVSPTYAREILLPEYSSGLEDFLRRRKSSIKGILNGIHYADWDPSADAHIAQTYSAEKIERRAMNKVSLQQELHFPQNNQTPLIGVISRLDYQKGIDLVPQAIRIIDKSQRGNWQLVILGTGDKGLEEEVHNLEAEYPDNTRVAVRFDETLSRRIFAGADMLLIPSRYEPCGLTQMIAMRYGCVPVGRKTGGLADAILDSRDPQTQSGFLFIKPTATSLARVIQRALRLYAQPDGWKRVQINGMRRDFSWDNSAREYLHLYMQLVERRRNGLADQKGAKDG